MSERAAMVLWNPGFRPFYLLAGVFSLVSILYWVAQLSGWLGATSSALTRLPQRSPFEVNRCTLQSQERPPGCPKHKPAACGPASPPT